MLLCGSPVLESAGIITNMNLVLTSLNADHTWLQNAKKAPNVSLGETVRARLKQFSVMNKLKKSALKVMPQIFLFDKFARLLHLLSMLYCLYI